MTFILLGGTIFRRENIQHVDIVEHVLEGGRFMVDHIRYSLRVHTNNAHNHPDIMTVGNYDSRYDAGAELARAFDIQRLEYAPPAPATVNHINPAPANGYDLRGRYATAEDVLAEQDFQLDLGAPDRVRMVRANRYGGTVGNIAQAAQETAGVDRDNF